MSVSEFARCGVHLGERADRESLKSAIRRGLRRLADVPGSPSVECRRTLEQDAVSARVRRDRDRRLAEPPDATLETWLLRNGQGLISPDVWRHFFPARPMGVSTGGAAVREVLLQSLRQAEACLGFAALFVSPGSPEGIALRRIRQAISTGIKTVPGQH